MKRGSTWVTALLASATAVLALTASPAQAVSGQFVYDYDHWVMEVGMQHFPGKSVVLSDDLKCYNTEPVVVGESDTYKPRNKTDLNLMVFAGGDCTGKLLEVIPPGKEGSSRSFQSVKARTW